MTRRALICGVGGQDGAYLAQLLSGKGYAVTGTSRNAAGASTDGLAALGIEGKVHVVSMSPSDYDSVRRTIVEAQPDEIYNLAGQSSVGLSFEQPVGAVQSNAIGALNVLEAVRTIAKPIRVFNAGSGECFGDTGGSPATEATPMRPRSPYAVAKTCAFHLVANYREAYRLHACTGILFNHESPIRPDRFVTRKIIGAALRIADGSKEVLSLGNLDIDRDWGWAPDYVEAMWLMLQQDTPADFVIATGRSVSLEYFVDRTFRAAGLDWRDHVKQDKSLFRPSDIRFSVGLPERIHAELGWKARTDVDGVIDAMCRSTRGFEKAVRL